MAETTCLYPGSSGRFQQTLQAGFAIHAAVEELTPATALSRRYRDRIGISVGVESNIHDLLQSASPSLQSPLHGPMKE